MVEGHLTGYGLHGAVLFPVMVSLSMHLIYFSALITYVQYVLSYINVRT